MIPTARVQRGPSEAARCASKGIVPATPSPFFSILSEMESGHGLHGEMPRYGSSLPCIRAKISQSNCFGATAWSGIASMVPGPR